jgi:hypothetical protein
MRDGASCLGVFGGVFAGCALVAGLAVVGSCLFFMFLGTAAIREGGVAVRPPKNQPAQPITRTLNVEAAKSAAVERLQNRDAYTLTLLPETVRVLQGVEADVLRHLRVGRYDIRFTAQHAPHDETYVVVVGEFVRLTKVDALYGEPARRCSFVVYMRYQPESDTFEILNPDVYDGP